jgi:hypothetical protein
LTQTTETAIAIVELKHQIRANIADRVAAIEWNRSALPQLPASLHPTHRQVIASQESELRTYLTKALLYEVITCDMYEACLRVADGAASTATSPAPSVDFDKGSL